MWEILDKLGGGTKQELWGGNTSTVCCRLVRRTPVTPRAERAEVRASTCRGLGTTSARTSPDLTFENLLLLKPRRSPREAASPSPSRLVFDVSQLPAQKSTLLTGSHERLSLVLSLNT